MRLETLIVFVLYGIIVALVLLGGIFGPPVVLLVGAGLAILWLLMLSGHRRLR